MRDRIVDLNGSNNWEVYYPVIMIGNEKNEQVSGITSNQKTFTGKKGC
jgi:hypothetical protein